MGLPIKGRKLRRRKQPFRRESSSQRGYDSRWNKARTAFLCRPENVLCRRCLDSGRTVEATCVDHVLPHRGDAGLFWDKSNWQPLCHRCHSIKTATEDGGFGNQPRTVGDN